MSKGQRGNKAAKKPKAHTEASRALPPASATPVLPGVVTHPFKRK